MQNVDRLAMDKVSVFADGEIQMQAVKRAPPPFARGGARRPAPPPLRAAPPPVPMPRTTAPRPASAPRDEEGENVLVEALVESHRRRGGCAGGHSEGAGPTPLWSNILREVIHGMGIKRNEGANSTQQTVTQHRYTLNEKARDSLLLRAPTPWRLHPVQPSRIRALRRSPPQSARNLALF